MTNVGFGRARPGIDGGTGPAWTAWPTLPAALLASLLSLAAVAPAFARCELEQVEIPVRIVDRRPIAMMKLNGIEVPMLVDSGAFFSMLSDATAARLNLTLQDLPSGLRIEGYTGRIQAHKARVPTVELIGAEWKDVEFIVGGNDLGAGIAGVLGRNFLSAGDTEYDLAHGRVWLVAPKGDCSNVNLAHWAGDAPVIVVDTERPNRFDKAILVEVGINGKRTNAMLDTGAVQTTLMLRTARRAGIDEKDLTPKKRAEGAGEGHAKSWIGPVDLFELGGERIANNRLDVDDVNPDDIGMLLGLDYFLSHRIYVSRLQKKLYITWNGGPVFARNRTSEGDADTRFAAPPQAVPPDDADALARQGAAATAAGNFRQALDDLDRACALAPGVADYFFARARLHLAMGKATPALADLDEALRLDPALAEARFRRALARAGTGDATAARADLAQLDASLPASANLRANMATLHAEFDQVPEALRQFDLWVNNHPSDAHLANALNGRCWLRVRHDVDLPLALDDCRRAVDLDDGNAAHHDSLGWIYLRLGNAAKAKKAFDAAIRLQALPFSLYGRALAQQRLYDPAGAARDLAAARQAMPSIDDEVRRQGFEFADAFPRPTAPGS